MSWHDLLAEAEAALGDRGEAKRLVERASGYDARELPLHLREAVPARAVPFFRQMVSRRQAGEPLQYVVGRWGFRTLDLLVDRRVLIPRPETEVVAGIALAEVARLGIRRPPLIVDLGTGSGAIALAVATERPDATVWATDASVEALQVARANLAGAGSRVATRVSLVAGHWYAALPAALAGTVDVVVSNPPYVAAGEGLPAEVAAWEPAAALYAGPAGTEAVAEIVAGARQWLRPGGALVVEIAPHQAAFAVEAARGAGLREPRVEPDLAGRPRVLVAAC